MQPLQNVISRHFERQCDRYALMRTGLRTAYVSAFQKLARQNKDDPDPHPVEVFLFHSHPPISERLAMAGEGWLASGPPSKSPDHAVAYSRRRKAKSTQCPQLTSLLLDNAIPVALHPLWDPESKQALHTREGGNQFRGTRLHRSM